MDTLQVAVLESHLRSSQSLKVPPLIGERESQDNLLLRTSTQLVSTGLTSFMIYLFEELSVFVYHMNSTLFNWFSYVIVPHPHGSLIKTKQIEVVCVSD